MFYLWAMTVKDRPLAGGQRAADILRDDPRWLLAQRVARSPAFSRATQLCAILVYVVRETVLHPDEPLRETEIAQHALGRGANFNPLDDSIVRVQMAHLRKRLERYFEKEGAIEETVITVALGSYQPVFSSRPPSLELPQEVSAPPGYSFTEVTPEPQSALASPPNSILRTGEIFRPGWLGLTLSWILTLAIAGWAGYLWSRTHTEHVAAADASNPVLKMLFGPGADMNVVLADTGLVTLQNTLHSDISIAEYISPQFPRNVLSVDADPALNSALEKLTESRYTSLNDADTVGQSLQWATLLGTKISVRYARYMHVRDFEHGNFVIVGSRRGNPWVTLFEPGLNFYFEEDPATHFFHFRNRHPQAGESEIYASGTGSGGSKVGYVDIALVPNLAGTGMVLLFNGFNMEANEAAEHLVFSRDLPPSVDKALHQLSSHSHVEILLRVRNLDRSELGWDIVSLRVS